MGAIAATPPGCKRIGAAAIIFIGIFACVIPCTVAESAGRLHVGNERDPIASSAASAPSAAVPGGGLIDIVRSVVPQQPELDDGTVIDGNYVRLPPPVVEDLASFTWGEAVGEYFRLLFVVCELHLLQQLAPVRSPTYFFRRCCMQASMLAAISLRTPRV